MATKYKLSYFDLRGRGELSRLMFILKGQAFEDHRIAQEAWAQEKENTPFGWLPVLTIDGANSYSDSMGIAKYLAREFGFGGKNNLEMLEIDQVTGIIQDVQQVLIKLFLEQDATKKAQMKKETNETSLPKYLKALEKILTKNGQFYVGKSLTVADVAVFDLFHPKLEESVMTNYPKVKANVSMVADNDKIKAYLATRKETPL